MQLWLNAKNSLQLKMWGSFILNMTLEVESPCWSTASSLRVWPEQSHDKENRKKKRKTKEDKGKASALISVFASYVCRLSYQLSSNGWGFVAILLKTNRNDPDFHDELSLPFSPPLPPKIGDKFWLEQCTKTPAVWFAGGFVFSFWL